MSVSEAAASSQPAIDFIHPDAVRAACAEMRLTAPLPHQALSIARMLDVFVYRRLSTRAGGRGDELLTTSGSAARLARALAREPACGFLLTDGMGMGKTFQAIATAVLLLTCEFEGAQPNAPLARVLVVLNSALIATWCEQIARHWRDVDMKRDVFVYSGRNRLARMQSSPARFVFSTYETLRADSVASASASAASASAADDSQTSTSSAAADVFCDVPWRLIIFDEVHKARNGRRSGGGGGSGLWRTLRRFPSDVPKLGLTGTPVCNNMMELCSIAQVIFKGHSVLSSEEFWSGYERHFTRDVLALLRGSILLRRTLASEGIELPPRTDTDVAIVLDAGEKVAYREAHDRMERALADLIDAGERHAPPFVVKVARDRYASSVNALGLATCGASKLQEVVRICAQIGVGEHGGRNERIVIVSRFVRVLESLRAELARAPETSAARVALFTGALDWKARGAVVDSFRARELDVVLLSTMAGNEGVDFSCCQHLVLVDSASAPNPMTHEDQVVARIYRIGQAKPSFIWRLIAVATIDDAFAFELHAQKRANAHALLDMALGGGEEGRDEGNDEGGEDAGGETLFRSVTSTADLLRRAVRALAP